MGYRIATFSETITVCMTRHEHIAFAGFPCAAAGTERALSLILLICP